MTLVVARIEGLNLFIESDSKVSDPLMVQKSPVCSVIKTVILNPLVTLSYAGDVPLAEEVIRNFYIKGISNVEELIDLINDISEGSTLDTDFIIGAADGGSPRLFRIRNNCQVERDLTSTWIGDVEAYSKYQEVYHSLEKNNPSYREMRVAISAVINSNKFESVGWFNVSVFLDHEVHVHPVFAYDIGLNLDANVKQHIPENTNTPLSVGSIEGGAYGVTFFASLSPKTIGLGIYFVHANLGILYYPKYSLQGEIIKGKSPVDFIKTILGEYNMPLHGFYLDEQGRFKHIDARKLLA